MSAGNTPLPWRTRAMGPWSTDSELGSHASWAIGTERGVIAIVVTHEHHDDPEFLANAALIVRAVNSQEALSEALAAYDSAMAACPANQQRLGDRLCPKCKAGPNEGCGREALAASDVIRAVRTALATGTEGAGHGG